MNVWLITVGEPLPIDTQNNRLYRSGMLAAFLSKRGHNVVWWTSDFNHTAKKRRKFSSDTISYEPKIEIRLLHGPGYTRNVSLRRLINHHYVGKDFASKARNCPRPDIIVCSFPTIELSYEAVRLSLEWKIPCILDIRDLWPDIFVSFLPKFLRFAGEALLMPLYRKTNFALKNASSIVGISESYLSWGLRHGGRGATSADTIIPLGYEFNDQAFLPKIDIRQILGLNDRAFIALFVGTFGRFYDIDTVIVAARMLEASGENEIAFVICGDGEQGRRWREKAKGLTSVIFTGWMEKEKLQSALKTATVGLLAYTENAPQSLPNKLFEYMSVGLPVLSSLRGEAKDLIEKNNIGLSYEAGDPADLVHNLKKMQMKQNLLEFSKNSKTLFSKSYSSDVVYGTYCGLIEQTGAAQLNKCA